MDAQDIIKKYSLVPHPEGGMYKEIYRSTLKLPKDVLPQKYNTDHCALTSIIFLLKDDNFSAFHKIISDEIWHYHAGDGVIIYCISQDGELSKFRLSGDSHPESVLQVVIPAETWFAAELINKKSFILTGCTVAPGFEFSDFKLAERQDLIQRFPQYKELIVRLTRGTE